MLVLSVLGVIMLGAGLRALIAEREAYGGRVGIEERSALRGALRILEGELRQVTSADGPSTGGTDIRTAGAESIAFRAQRKVGFVCEVQPADQWVAARPLGEPFIEDDALLLFVDGDSLDYRDDRWETVAVAAVSGTRDPSCPQRLQLGPMELDGVYPGAPVRSYEWVRYGLYDFGALGWGLGRRRPGEPVRLLVGNLAGPGEGLVLEYFDAAGKPTGEITEIARARITARRISGTGEGTVQVTTTVYLRNN
ncbi:MAG: hypothetical protein GWM90_22335 [Gemmatimonadetes bacterium]|nr:hypothetical protein [Gemmatimonadota bacterium]NIQ57349.1 hypothetical protein [Gemmatimonadota bacterium]NIU77512.1 hypothetical protein [Gammaproteobacteria bacterium]NIX46720.1 hypothetical protein [Gemmatimonadota bacterium]NIY11068.1 hypothetical protein [Gemmatimonadota bacterium]